MILLQQDILYVAICDDVTLEESPRLIEGVKQQYQRCGQKLYYLAVIPETAPLPDAAVRNEMSRGLREIHDYCQYTALVFCGQGFKASTKRAVFATMLLLIMKGRWHVGSSVDELIAKAAGHPDRIAYLRAAAYLAAGKGFHI